MRAPRESRTADRRRRPGPAPGFRNPSPVGDGIEEPRTDWIPPHFLDFTEQRLRQHLVARRKELRPRPGEGIEDAIRRIARVGRRAVEETEAAWWSGQIGSYTEEPAKPRRE